MDHREIFFQKQKVVMSMNPMAKWMITIGIVLIVAGLLWQVGGRFLNLGRLPGDIVVERENFKFYFPVVTCLIISAVLSLIFYVARFFK
mgnify:CR=1 FL=1